MIKTYRTVFTLCICLIVGLLLFVSACCISGCINGDTKYCQISTEAANETIDGLQNTDQVHPINCDIQETPEYVRFAEEVELFKSYGKKVGFIMLDLKRCKGVACNIDFPWCSQSTIKAPYVASLLEWDQNVWVYWEDTINKIITLSDNQAYEDIYEYYGGGNQFADFLQAAGVDTKYSNKLYPRDITVRDMAKIWTKMYTILNPADDHTGIMSKFAKCFEHTVYSSTQDVIGRKYKTHCKAGWEDGIGSNDDNILTNGPVPRMIDGDPANDEVATNDTGIVYAGDNPYLLISFTNFAANPSYMYDFAEAIDSVHDVIVDN